MFRTCSWLNRQLGMYCYFRNLVDLYVLIEAREDKNSLLIGVISSCFQVNLRVVFVFYIGEGGGGGVENEDPSQIASYLNILLYLIVSTRNRFKLRTVFVFYIWGIFAENENLGQI